AFAVFYAARPGAFAWYLSGSQEKEGGFFTLELTKVLAREVKPTVGQIANAISKECKNYLVKASSDEFACNPVFEASDPNLVFLEPAKSLGSTTLALEISSPVDHYPSGAYRIASQKFDLAGSVIDAHQFGRLIVDHQPTDMDPKGN